MRKLVIGMAMASTAFTTPALARDNEWYVGVEAGPMLVEDISLDVNGASNDAQVDHDNGYDIGGIVGHDFGAFRLEAETAYKSASLDQASAGSQGLARSASQRTNATNVPANGDTSVLSFMVNGLFDFGPDDGLQGFVGAGLGVARVDLQGSINSFGSGAFDDSDTGLAWQLLGGVRAPISDSFDVGLKYRYFNAPNVEILDPQGVGLETDLSSHSILGSIIYNFGGEAPPP
ncbi:MAG: outer membrane beta-barrel protein, partial [Marinomonas sp.]